MKLLYVHGYNGSPHGTSYNLLKRHLPQGWEIIGMDYCQDDCALALQQIASAVTNEGIDIVAGSSLGGFLTLLTEGVERYVINPCYLPSVELPKLDACSGLPCPSPQMIATYAAFERRLSDIQDRHNIHCLMGDSDELLGFTYLDAITHNLGKRPCIVFSSHHLSESAAKTICSLIGKDTQTMLKDAHKYSVCNQKLVEKSPRCGCFSCRRVFDSNKIDEYFTDKTGMTAICPYCSIDAVLPECNPYGISERFLDKMHRKWF